MTMNDQQLIVRGEEGIHNYAFPYWRFVSRIVEKVASKNVKPIRLLSGIMKTQLGRRIS
jgi:hypothetical protein